MPRANRYMFPGYTYHLTHRCVNKEHLLRYQKDRKAYRKWLREGVRRHGVVLYGYCLTSNHVHVIARVDSTESVSKMMQLAAGTTAQAYNRRRGRSGAFWAEQYHCTVIEDGDHLWRCLRYVDLNMVRAGVVEHPRQWEWCGYHELVGARQRYRLLSVDDLLEALGGLSRDGFRESYKMGLDEVIAAEGDGQGAGERRPEWTEALAVGSREFVEDLKGRYHRRLSIETQVQPDGAGGRFWTLRDSEPPYRLS
mgnify:CR=1 FL=1